MKETLHIKIATLLALGILTASNANAQFVLVNQALDTGPGRTGFNSTLGYYSVYDDFTLGGGPVGTVGWFGTDSGITGFTVSFWTDNFGSPGTLLESDSISGLAGATPTGISLGSLPVYSYEVNLTAPFSGSFGTEYFLSIVASAAPGGGFFWADSMAGNGGGYQVGRLGDPDLVANTAFTLDEAAVPEPGVIALGVIGASAFLIRRARGAPL